MSKSTENKEKAALPVSAHINGTPPILTIMNVNEFRAEKESFSHHRELLHSLSSIRYCKAEVFKDSMIGILQIPQKSAQRSPQMSFGIHMTNNTLTFIEDTGNLKQWLEKKKDLLKDLSAPDQILLQVMEMLIEEDIYYLSHFEKELEQMEEQLIGSVPKDFFLSLTKLRQKLSEFNAYYDQLTAIGELMQSHASHSLVQTSEDWSNYTHRTERLQNHVQLLMENVIQLRELYQSQQDAKQNRIMEILTIVTTLFLPLTLLTGWYGMNFANMPELQWQYGYPAVIAAAVIIVLLEILYFKKKRFF